MLRLNPHSRYSAAECLNHEFFKLNYEEEVLLPQSIIDKKQLIDQGQDHVSKRQKFNWVPQQLVLNRVWFKYKFEIECVIFSKIITKVMTDQIKIGHYILGKTIGTGGFAKVKST